MLIESRINSMKYRDIQVECKHFGLVATGNKEVLRERLLAHLLEEESQGKTDRAGEFDSKETREEMQADAKEEKDEAVHEVAAYDVEMKEDPSFFVDKEAPKHSDLDPAQQVEKALFPVRISCSSIQAEADVVMHEASEESRKVQVDQSCKDPPGKAIDDTAASVGPEDYVSRSPLAGFVKEALKSITQSAQKSKTHCADSIPEDDISPPPSDFTSSTESSKISGPSVRELVSKLSNPSNSALSKSVQAKKEARMARMAEMRGKVSRYKCWMQSHASVISFSYFLHSVPTNQNLVGN